MLPKKYDTFSSGFKNIGCDNFRLCTVILPPIESVALDKPAFGLYSKNINTDSESVFVSSKNHSEIYFHRAHKKKDSLCMNCESVDHKNNFFNIIAQHFFTPVYNQNVSLESAKVGRNKLLFNIEKFIHKESLNNGSAEWKPKKLLEVIDKQKQYLNRLARYENYYINRCPTSIGLTTGCFLFQPEYIEEYLKEKKLTNYLIFSK